MPTSSVETLAYGFGLIEGPRYGPDGNLYFSDVPNGGVRALTASGEVEVVIPKRRGVGGIAIHADGGLVVGGRNICHVKDGETRILFESDALGFNDLMTDAEGRVICGTIRSDPFGEEADRTPGEAHRIATDGSVEEMYGGVSLTNGIGFSPDGQRIYHADTGNNHIIGHDVEGDRYVNRRAIAQSSGFNPDGLAVDVEGTIWVADYGAGCVRGFDDAGSEVGRIDVPGRAVTSLCFGGADRRDLFIVTADNTDDRARAGSIFKVRVDVAGLDVPQARV